MKRHASLAQYVCEYCGLACLEIDHVPPKCVRPIIFDLRIRDKIEFVEVRCCRECNSLLGHKPLWTVASRKAYIKKQLRKRYKKYLALPNWDENELRMLGYRLRKHVEQGLAIRDLTRKRIAH
jgi:hypothetical protein